MLMVATLRLLACCVIDRQFVFNNAFAIDQFGGNTVKKKASGFTLLEMLVVLFIISLLLLLFVPKLMTQKDNASKKSDGAIAKVVETQIEVYELDHGKKPSREELIDEGYVKEEQYKAYERAQK